MGLSEFVLYEFVREIFIYVLWECDYWLVYGYIYILFSKHDYWLKTLCVEFKILDLHNIHTLQILVDNTYY